MKIVIRVLLGAGLIALGFWLWTILFPSPEKLIRKRIAEVAQRASFPSAENIVKTGLRIQGLVNCFAPKVEIAINVPRDQHHEIAGRDEISSSAGIARQSLRWLKVELLDPSITIASDKETAVVNLTAKVTFPDQRDFFVQEMKVTLKKIDGKWLIIRLETIKTLSRATTGGSFVSLNRNLNLSLSACSKTVASAILADLELGFQPGGRNHTTENGSLPLERYRHAGDLSGWQDATLYGRPGGPPLLFKQALNLPVPLREQIKIRIKNQGVTV